LSGADDISNNEKRQRIFGFLQLVQSSRVMQFGVRRQSEAATALWIEVQISLIIEANTASSKAASPLRSAAALQMLYSG
jgi:hypothetical protein